MSLLDESGENISFNVLGSCVAGVIEGIEALRVDVEVDVGRGLPFLKLVGLPSASVKESEERVKAAIRHAGFEWPVRRVTVNLAPADMRKEGSSFDLPVALAILSATGAIDQEQLKGWMALGELSLDGKIRPIRGALSFAILASEQKIPRILLPRENAAEAALCDTVQVYAAASLAEALDMIASGDAAPVVAPLGGTTVEAALDFSDVRGQEEAKRAALVAASGGHNLLMLGPPGSGKTMIARRIPTILPELSLPEAMECLRIHSVSGTRAAAADALLLSPPFRSPHHTASRIGMVGGGSPVRPGEVTLAQNGVLFLDELPEFQRDVLESLRQPLEDGFITVTRARSRATFPTRFMLVAAMNPCPCGHAGSDKRCECTEGEVVKYRRRISGPLLDRIDIQVEVPRTKVKASGPPTGADSRSLRQKVEAARRKQKERYGDGAYLNATAPPNVLRRTFALSHEAERLAEQAVEALGLSARAADKISRIARTIADLDDAERIEEVHVAEAVRYRALDRR